MPKQRFLRTPCIPVPPSAPIKKPPDSGEPDGLCLPLGCRPSPHLHTSSAISAIDRRARPVSWIAALLSSNPHPSLTTGTATRIRTEDLALRRGLLSSPELWRPNLALRAGFKPAASAFGGRRSVRLSYRSNLSQVRLRLSALNNGAAGWI